MKVSGTTSPFSTMDDEFADGPVCDFCEIAVEKGEMLEPIYVGELPQPKPHYLSEVQEKADRGFLLGEPFEGYIALSKALRNCDDIDLNMSEAVYEPEPMRMDPTETPDMEFGDNVNHEKVGVELRIRPKDVTYEPDAKVCDTCAKMFRSLGSD